MSSIKLGIFFLLLGALFFYAQEPIGLVLNEKTPYVRVLKSPLLDLTQEMTLEAWIFPKEFGTQDWQNPVISKHGNFSGWELRVGNQKATMLITLGRVHHSVTASEKLLPKEWVYVVGTYDGKMLSIYLNGQLRRTVSPLNRPYAITPYSGPVTIAANHQWKDRRFQGNLGEIRIWKRALSLDEVETNYKNGLQRIKSFQTQPQESIEPVNWKSFYEKLHKEAPAGLVLSYDFFEKFDPENIVDYSGNQLHGTCNLSKKINKSPVVHKPPVVTKPPVVEEQQTSKKNIEIAETYFSEGSQQFDIGNFSAAVEFYTKAIQSDPKNSLFYLYRGDAYYFNENINNATNDYWKASQLSSSKVIGFLAKANLEYLRNNVKGAIHHSTNAIDYSKTLPLEKRKFLALAYLYRGVFKDINRDFEGAIADFNEVLRLEPQNADAYRDRGITYSRQKKYKEALEDLDQALHLNPHYGRAYRNRGEVQTLQGDFEGAVADFTEAIALNSTYIDAYFNRAFTKRKQKDFEGAIQDFTELIRLRPRSAQLYMIRGKTYYFQELFDSAMQDFDRAIQMNGYDPHFYLCRGILNTKKGNLMEAREDFQKAKALDYLKELEILEISAPMKGLQLLVAVVLSFLVIRLVKITFLAKRLAVVRSL